MKQHTMRKMTQDDKLKQHISNDGKANTQQQLSQLV